MQGAQAAARTPAATETAAESAWVSRKPRGGSAGRGAATQPRPDASTHHLVGASCARPGEPIYPTSSRSLALVGGTHIQTDARARAKGCNSECSARLKGLDVKHRQRFELQPKACLASLLEDPQAVGIKFAPCAHSQTHGRANVELASHQDGSNGLAQASIACATATPAPAEGSEPSPTSQITVKS